MMTPLSGIITKGLGLPAANNMIINYFSLTLEVGVIPVPPPVGGGGGGPYPGPAWNVFTPAQAQGFYKPYVPQQQDMLWQSPQRTRAVYIRINFRGRQVEKIYEVTEKRADQVVNVLNVTDKLRKRAEVTITNLRKLAPSISDFRRVASKITVMIKSVRREKN